MENKRNRYDVILCNTPQKFIKATSNQKFKSAIVFCDNLIAAELTKVNITLDAPIAIGAAVLDISKTIMYAIAYHDFPKYEKQFQCK